MSIANLTVVTAIEYTYLPENINSSYEFSYITPMYNNNKTKRECVYFEPLEKTNACHFKVKGNLSTLYIYRTYILAIKHWVTLRICYASLTMRTYTET